MLSPGYYDVHFQEQVATVLEDGSWSQPCWRDVVWQGARVLMTDVNDDVIVEHHPLGWGPTVMRCIERVPARMVNVPGGYRFEAIPTPEAL